MQHFRTPLLVVLAVALNLGFVSHPAPLFGQNTAADSAKLLAAQADSVQQRLAASGVDLAIALRTKAAALYQRAGQASDEGLMLHRIGTLYMESGRQDSAMIYLRRALTIRRQVGDRDAEGRTLNNMGQVFGILGRTDSSVTYFRRALTLFREVGFKRGESLALSNIGAIYSRVGRPDSALASFRQAYAVLRELGDRRGQGITLNNIGTVYEQLGRPDSALAYLRQALPHRRQAGDRAGEGETLTNIGILNDAFGLPDSALAYHRQALAIRREIGDRQGEGYTLNNIGSTYQTLGRPDSAIAYYRLALARRREAGDRSGEGWTLHNIGSAYEGIGARDSALAYYGQALPIWRETHDPRGEGETLGNIGAVYLRSNSGERDLGRATAYLDSAAAAYARIRGQAGSDANRVSFAERVRLIHSNWALAWLARSHEVGERVSIRAALAAAERGRGQALLQLMHPSAPEATGAAGVSDSPSRPGGDLAAEADSLTARLVRNGTASLTYLVTSDTLVVWLVLPSGAVHLARIAITRDSLAALVSALRVELEPDTSGTTMASQGGEQRSARATLAVLETPATVTPTALATERRPAAVRGGSRPMLGRLSRIVLPPELWEPLRRALPNASDLVIVPNGALSLLPFGAVPTDRNGEPLGLRYALRFAPSLGALVAAEGRPALPLGRERRRGIRRALVVGNPAMPSLPGLSAGTTLEALPSAEREARWLAQRLGVRPLIGSAATETAVASRLPSADLIHLATHGLAYNSDAKARDSFLALARDSANDGLLTVGEVLDHLDDPARRLTAELVVLSACQTGLGQMREAEGTVGLARAFLARGAQSALVSLWVVSDQATELLMRRFYVHWLDDTGAPSKAEALRRAQADVRKVPGFEDPRYWAAFQLVGAR